MADVRHPLIREGAVQSRLYQEAILSTASQKNTLCVLPTGLGKTSIAILLAAHRLERFPGSRVLVMAPTRPLVNQHLRSFSEALNLPPEGFQVLTGVLGPGKRRGAYMKSVILATPQVIRNDLESGVLSLEGFSLLVIDEAHHSVGEYAYPSIAKAYLEQAEHPRILGLTASPGATREKIEEIRRNVGAEAVEIRTEEDGDTLPYVKETDVEWIEVDLPESFLKIRDYLTRAYGEKAAALRRMGLVRGGRVSKKELLLVQQRLQRELASGKRWGFGAVSVAAEALKLEHAIILLETQGITMLQKYWNKLGKDGSRAAAKMLASRDVAHAVHLTNELFEEGSRHPKMGKLCTVVQEEISRDPDSRIIVFANYRDSVREIVSVLSRIGGARPVEFVGQKEGLTQKEQLSRLRDFRDGAYNVLVGTSVSEEGLSIQGADLAVFYEPVPSEIRTIQRRGRVGRYARGRVVVLMARGTRDQAYFWTSRAKEKSMRGVVTGLRGQNSLRIY
jgi:ERCC4-related helicase